MELHMFRTGFLSSTVYTAIGICHTGYADCLLASSQHNLYDMFRTGFLSIISSLVLYTQQ